jgi:hypothetical protein
MKVVLDTNVIVNREDINMNTITTKNTRIAALKGSITESLIGAIPNTGKPLDDYRAERLSKYERITVLPKTFLDQIHN